MKETVEGIILNETNFKESSKILNILTPKYGYISVISKGSRNIKSKLRGISMKLVYGEFTIKYKENGISMLLEGCLINSFKNIMTDFNKMLYATSLVNVTKSILKENNDSNIFYPLINSLIKINDGFNPMIISIICYIKYLDFLGVRPNFSNCSLCGSTDIYNFSMEYSGFICKKCYQDTYLFTTNTLKLLKLFQNIDIKKIDKLNITSSKVLEELDLFIKEYYEKYTGIYLNNKLNNYSFN